MKDSIDIKALIICENVQDLGLEKSLPGRTTNLSMFDCIDEIQDCILFKMILGVNIQAIGITSLKCDEWLYTSIGRFHYL